MCILYQWKKQKENPEHLNILSFLRIKLRIYISHYTHVWCIRYIARISLSCLTLNQVYVLLAKYAHFAQTTRDAQPIQINFAHILIRARDSTPFSRDTNIYIFALEKWGEFVYSAVPRCVAQQPMINVIELSRTVAVHWLHCGQMDRKPLLLSQLIVWQNIYSSSRMMVL